MKGQKKKDRALTAYPEDSGGFHPIIIEIQRNKNFLKTRYDRRKRFDLNIRNSD